MNFISFHFEQAGIWDKNPDSSNQKRIETIASLIPEDTMSILDVGCGNGLFTNYINHNFKMERVHGVDQSESALKYVIGEKSKGNIENLSFKNFEFDAVSCLEVLEHLQEDTYKKAISEIARIAKKYIILSVPNNEILETHFVKCPKCKTQFHFTNHLRSFTEKDIKSLFTCHGFSAKNIYLGGEKTQFKYITSIKRIIKNKKNKEINYSHKIYCPACKHILMPNTKINGIHTTSNNKKTLKTLKDILPKKISYNWIYALYQRDDYFNNHKSIE